MSDKPQEENIKDQIIALLEKGYKRDQLIKDFKFAERTVDAAIRVYKETSNGNAEDAKESSRPTADDGASAPSSKSGGKGVTGTPGRDGALAIRKDKESVLPEWLERDVAEIFDGQTRDQKIFLAGMSVPLMGLRLFAEGVKPIIDLLATWQEGQAQAARAAQGSGIEVAHAAAEEAAMRVGQQVQEAARQAATAGSRNPMASMVAQTMQPFFGQMMGRMFGMLTGVGQPPGPMPNQPGQPPQQSPTRGKPSASTPGTEQVSQEEIKEVFEDD
jgi:hypothetical protein